MGVLSGASASSRIVLFLLWELTISVRGLRSFLALVNGSRVVYSQILIRNRSLGPLVQLEQLPLSACECIVKYT